MGIGGHGFLGGAVVDYLLDEDRAVGIIDGDEGGKAHEVGKAGAQETRVEARVGDA